MIGHGLTSLATASRATALPALRLLREDDDMIRGEEERVKLQNETEERTGFDFSVLRKILVVEERMSSLLPLELFELVLSYSKFNPLWRAAQTCRSVYEMTWVLNAGSLRLWQRVNVSTTVLDRLQNLRLSLHSEVIPNVHAGNMVRIYSGDMSFGLF